MKPVRSYFACSMRPGDRLDFAGSTYVIVKVKNRSRSTTLTLADTKSPQTMKIELAREALLTYSEETK